MIDSALLGNPLKHTAQKDHWIVWNTLPQCNNQVIDANTHNDDIITHKVFSWGKNDKNVESSLEQYLNYTFALIVVNHKETSESETLKHYVVGKKAIGCSEFCTIYDLSENANLEKLFVDDGFMVELESLEN